MLRVLSGDSPLEAVLWELWHTSLEDSQGNASGSNLRRADRNNPRLIARYPECFLGTDKVWIFYHAVYESAVFSDSTR